MKKIFMIISAALLLAGAGLFMGCKNGEDGLDGSSAEALILKETGNVWYEYTNKDDTDSTPSANSDNYGTVNFSKFYIKYNTSSKKLIVVATGNSDSVATKLFYASKEAELSSGKWAASVVTLRLMGKITKASSDPTSGKIDITNLKDLDLGNYSAEKLIKKLFE